MWPNAREALAKLAEMRNRKQKLVDPLQFEMSIAAEDLSGYVPSFGWEMAPVSDKQKGALEKAGLFPDDVGAQAKRPCCWTGLTSAAPRD